MQKLTDGKCPRIKICGITRASDLGFIAAAGVDTIGINLVPSSRRCVDHATARQLAIAARQHGLVVTAVLRNPAKELLHEVQSQTYWDFIQLHGDETPEIVSAGLPVSIIKAVSWTGRAEEAELVNNWVRWAEGIRLQPAKSTQQSTQQRLACFLVDAYAPSEGGGTGRTAQWSRLSPRPSQFKQWPMLLAGGLDPINVLVAIRSTRCDGVDSASGVELSPGAKSKELVVDFVTHANAGFAESL